MRNLPSPPRVCLFRLADRIFALDIRWVREVVEVAAVTRLPLAPAEVLGVFAVRGSILPLIHLSALLGLEDRVGSSRAVVVRHAERQAALAVSEVLSLEALEVTSPSAGLGVPSEYLSGQVIWRGETVPVLAVPKVLEALAARVQGVGRESNQPLGALG
ncbi:MAG: hypothetical protein C4327_07375 [Meiothermus sp.]